MIAIFCDANYILGGPKIFVQIGIQNGINLRR